jgi:hypothetical protein
MLSIGATVERATGIEPRMTSLEAAAMAGRLLRAPLRPHGLPRPHIHNIVVVALTREP